MIRDLQLRTALEAVDDAIAAALPSESCCDHTFSPRFEQKMQRVFRRAAHPVARKVLLHAACALLVLTALLSCLVAFHPAVRAKVMGWIREWMGDFHSYSHQVPARSVDMPRYYLSELPEGYVYTETAYLDSQYTIFYTSDSGQIIRFTYLQGSQNASLYNKHTEYAVSTTSINGYIAELYIAITPELNNHVVWYDSDNSMIFYISGACSEDALIRLAEGACATDSAFP